MSAASSPALEPSSRRAFRRHAIGVPLDVVALCSGVPENLPGRCTDISEAGVGAVVAGELAAGQQVAVELRLPDVGVPVRARAVVRYQLRLHCGVEFVGLSADQREMIRYWIYRSAADAYDYGEREQGGVESTETAVVADPDAIAVPGRKLRIGRRGLYLLIASLLALAVLGWWQWQRSWNELEKRTPGESRVRVSPETHSSTGIMQNAPLVRSVAV